MRLTCPPLVAASKKSDRYLLRPPGGTGRTHPQDRAEPLLCRLQKTHVALVVASLSRQRLADSLGQLGRSRQCFRRGLAGAQLALLRATVVVVASDCRGRHGLSGRSSQATLPRAVAGRRRHEASGGHETGAALYELEPNRLLPGPAFGMARLCGQSRPSLVWRDRPNSALFLLLAGDSVSKAICLRPQRA